MQVIFHKSGFFDEMRCSLIENGSRPDSFDPLYQKDLNPTTGKVGVRHYSLIAAIFWRILKTVSLGKIDRVEVITSQKGEEVYLDKESYIEWKHWKNVKKIKRKNVGNSRHTAATLLQEQQIRVEIRTKDNLMEEKNTCVEEYNKKMAKFGNLITEAINKEDQATLKSLNDESVKVMEDHKKRLLEIDKQIKRYTLLTNQKPSEKKVPPVQIYPTGGSTKAVGPNPIYTSMLKDLEKGCALAFREIFEVFFTHFDPNVLTSWKKDPEGTCTYTGTLAKTIKLWIPQGGENDPKGGIIIMLGNNDSHKVTLSLDQKNRSIKVAEGLNLCCDTKFGIFDTISLVEFAHLDGDIIKTEAGVRIPFGGFLTQEKKTTKDKVLDSWKKGIPLSDSQNHEKFLAEKIKTSKW